MEKHAGSKGLRAFFCLYRLFQRGVLPLFCRLQIFKVPQVSQLNPRSIHFGVRIFLLATDGGRNFPFQLATDTLRSEQADLFSVSTAS